MTANDEKLFLKKLNENEDFLNRATMVENADDFIAIMNEIGVTVSWEEASDIMAQVHEKRDDIELTEEMLDAVNGGCFALIVITGIFILMILLYRLRLQNLKYFL